MFFGFGLDTTENGRKVRERIWRIITCSIGAFFQMNLTPSYKTSESTDYIFEDQMNCPGKCRRKAALKVCAYDLYIMVKCVCVCHEKVTKFVWPPPLFFQIFVAKFFFKYFLKFFIYFCKLIFKFFFFSEFFLIFFNFF